MVDADDNADVVGELQASLCFYEHHGASPEGALERWAGSRILIPSCPLGPAALLWVLSGDVR